MIEPEFSRPLPIERIRAGGHEETVTATQAERERLALRLGIPALLALSCRWRLRPGAAGRVEASGHISARMVRDCVLTLEPFNTESVEDFQVVFVPAGTEIDDEDPESVDQVPYGGVVIDLGEAASEQLALTLDPYPQKPGAVLPEFDPPDESASPFAALARRAKDV